MLCVLAGGLRPLRARAAGVAVNLLWETSSARKAHRPSFRQSQWPAKVRARGRCQGLGEPVRSILPGSFHGVILPGIIKITSSVCAGLCYRPSYAVSFIKQQSSAAEEGCCYPLVEPPSRTCVVCTRHCARRPARSHFSRDRLLSQGIHCL